jgi:UDP-glucose 4-epimerase
MLNILVTGGAGYIGSSLVERLNELEEVEKIYVLDNLSRSPLAFFLGKQKLAKAEFVKGDILDSHLLDELVEKVDVIYHLAGYVLSPYNYAQNVQYEQINRWGTLNLVRCVQRAANTIERFVYLSSLSVHGLRGKVNLTDEPQPTNAYGKSKLAAEKFVHLLEDRCKVNIIRSANVFGFNNSFRSDSVLNKFIFHGIVEHKILIYGDGSQQRPFVSLDQAAGDLLNLHFNDSSDRISNSIGFNADLVELKNWLVENHLPGLEYSFVNRNIDYEGQFIEGAKNMKEEKDILDRAFNQFKDQIRIG